jgi:hypothetical protein
MRTAVTNALVGVAARFSDEAPRIDEEALIRRYSAFEAWPADGQLGLCVLVWALGSGFSLGKFVAHVNQLVPNFARAATCIGPGDTPIEISIGAIARAAFRNAAIVVRWNLDAGLLHWPTDLSKTVGSGRLSI